jgi:hypothetical protein
MTSLFQESSSPETCGIFGAGLDVLRVKLWICSQNVLAGLSGGELLQNEINRNAGSLEAGLTHPDVVSSFDICWEHHHLNSIKIQRSR